MRKNLTCNQFIIFTMMFVTMAFMISDYKVLCNKIGAICSMLVFLTVLLKNQSGLKLKSNIETNVCVAIFIFLLYFTLTSLPSFSISVYVEKILYYLIEFVPLFLAMHIYRNPDRKLIKLLLVSFLVIWNIFCVISFVCCMQTPDLARLMAAERSKYYNSAIGGGYPMAYGSAIFSVFVFEYLLKGNFKNKKTKSFAIFEIVLMLLVIYATHSFIVLISTILGFALSLMNKFINGKYKFVIFVATMAATVLLWLNIENILSYLVLSAKNEFWYTRWSEVYNYVVYGQESYHIGLRFYVYELSIETIKTNTFLGSGYLFGNDYSLIFEYGVGNHSTVLDTLAQFGLVGGLPFLYLCLYPYFFNKKHGFSASYLVTFYIMLFLNPIFSCYHMILIIFLVIPLIQYSFKNQVFDL